jgi:predicted GNAT family acetyltransferase
MRVRDNTEAQRFEIEAGEGLAFLQYEREPDSIVFLHTEVPPALQGRGLAATLAKGALESARAQGLRVVAVCPFVRSYMRKHPGA